MLVVVVVEAVEPAEDLLHVADVGGGGDVAGSLLPVKPKFLGDGAFV